MSADHPTPHVAPTSPTERARPEGLSPPHDVAPGVDPSTLLAVLRALLTRLREMAPTSSDINGHIGGKNTLETLFGWRDYIHSHESDDSEPLLSIVLLVQSASRSQVSDALVALDAQSSRNFELIVVPGAVVDLVSIEELLAPFSSGLATCARIVEESSRAATRKAALSAGLAAARGRWVTFLDATSIVFGHFVATFADLSQASPAAVLRARALSQPLREMTWPDGHSGYEPLGGAMPASEPYFSVIKHLEHLGHSGSTDSHGSPPGSYALRRRDVDLLGLHDDDDQLLLEAAILGGVHDAPDDVVVLLHHFVESDLE